MKRNISKKYGTLGGTAGYGDETCAGMEWCDPEGSRTADAAKAQKNTDFLTG